MLKNIGIERTHGTPLAAVPCIPGKVWSRGPRHLRCFSNKYELLETLHIYSNIGSPSFSPHLIPYLVHYRVQDSGDELPFSRCRRLGIFKMRKVIINIYRIKHVNTVDLLLRYRSVY